MFAETNDQLEFRRSVRSIMEAFPDEYWRKLDAEERFPWEFYREFAKAGFLGASVPQVYGGSGLSLSDVAVMLQQVAESGAGLTGAGAVHMSMFGIAPIIRFASEAMRRGYLPGIMSGEIQICFGVTEADAGMDTTKITTFARLEGSDYVVNGRKVWISKAQEADFCLLFVRTRRPEDCVKRTDGFSLLLVPMATTGVTHRPIPMMGRRAIVACELFLDDVRVPASQLVGEEGNGFRYLLDGLNAERILLSYEAVGLGRAALSRAVTYANERNVFGRLIGSNQGVQFPLAESHVRLEAADLAARKAAWLYDRGEPCGAAANTAKFLAAEAAFQAADRAVQTLGGFGYASEYHVERYFREARLLLSTPVSQNLVLSFLAERVLGLPRSF